MRFIGILFKMASLFLPNREHFWWVSDWDGKDTQIGKFMSKNVFRRTLQCYKLPKVDKGLDNMCGYCQVFFNEFA